MTSSTLQWLTRHFYKDGTHSYHYECVEANQDDALVNTDEAASFSNSADLFTDWPPQPMTAWLNQSPHHAGGMLIPVSE
jgi:hypothetical protein